LNTSSLKTIIYTANFGGYDRVHEPMSYDKNCTYLLFTDSLNLKSKIWDVIRVAIPKETDSQMSARYYKLNPHLVLPEHNVSLWVDSSFQIKRIPIKQILQSNPGDIVCYSHPNRRCIYEEAVACINKKLDYREIIANQIDFYRNEGFPVNHGLFATGIMIRRNSDLVCLFNEHWWQQVQNGSRRDQLSQMYSSWKTGCLISAFNVGRTIYKNPYFRKLPHNIERQIHG